MGTFDRKSKAGATRRTGVETSRNGSGSPSAPNSGLSDIVQSGGSSVVDKKAPSSPPTRKASGPRTPQGKERSKHNALKHGIFSELVVLNSESPAEFRSLLKRLREDCQPEGIIEETLVEKLAAIIWRYRRLIAAERAEIQECTEFMAWDKESQKQEEVQKIELQDGFDPEDGLIRRIRNSEVLDSCLDLLAELEEGIRTLGFDRQRDDNLLAKIYGNSKITIVDNLLFNYYKFFLTAEVTEEERQEKGYATPEQCKQFVLDLIGVEIRKLERYGKSLRVVEAKKMKVERLRRSVPDSPILDRLLRYEASLERAFERTLNQLERLQRMRLGQPVPPALRLELSH